MYAVYENSNSFVVSLTKVLQHHAIYIHVFPYAEIKRKHGKHETLIKEQHHQDSSKTSSGKLERQPDKGNKRRELRTTTLKKSIRPSLKLDEKCTLRLCPSLSESTFEFST